MHRSILALLLAAAPLASPNAAPVDGAAPEVDWMKVTLDGRKIGQLESRTERNGDRVTSIERMSLVIDRGGVSLPVQTEERSTETADGKPLSFASKLTFSGLATETEGTIGDGGKVSVVTRSAGREDRRELDWPAGAVLAHGARLAEEKNGLAPGTTYHVLAFQPSDLTAIPVDVRIVSRGKVRLDDHEEDLVEVEQRADLLGSPFTMKAWITPEHEVRKSVLPLLGLELVMLACDEACANAPNQPADILEHAVVRAPAALTPALRRDGVRYRIAVRGAEPPRLPDTGEQKVTGEPRELRVDVDPTPESFDRSAPEADERGPNRWVESDDAGIMKMAKEVAGNAKDDGERMRRFERQVSEYITNKSMRVGYASARETLRSREGDCTEHAVLLAALARAQGIPARVVNGLAYAPSFAGYKRAFIPHAWVQAYVDGAWHSYDAALGAFDAGHIALSLGSGEASGFYAGVSLLGNLEVLDAQPLPASH